MKPLLRIPKHFSIIQAYRYVMAQSMVYKISLLGGVVAAASLGCFGAHHAYVASSFAKSHSPSAQSATQAGLSTLTPAQKSAAQSVSQSPAGQPTATTNKASSTEPAKTSSQPQTKYSTSSDPRSTAYSTTPPAPNPASFTTKITHAGQVAAGTLISYNATKGEKAYYGGDLLLSTSTIYFSRSGVVNYSHNVTVTVPDGATVGMPSSPWDDTSPYVGIAMDSSQYKPAGTSFNMLVQTYGNPPLGTYRLHISTGRTAQTADAWQYDGFITVVVVN